MGWLQIYLSLLLTLLLLCPSTLWIQSNTVLAWKECSPKYRGFVKKNPDVEWQATFKLGDEHLLPVLYSGEPAKEVLEEEIHEPHPQKYPEWVKLLSVLAVLLHLLLLQLLLNSSSSYFGCEIYPLCVRTWQCCIKFYLFSKSPVCPCGTVSHVLLLYAYWDYQHRDNQDSTPIAFFLWMTKS